MIGQFSGLKFKLILLQWNCFVIYRQLFLTFIASKNFIYTLNYVLKRTNDLKMIFKLTRFAFEVLQKFEAVPRE